MKSLVRLALAATAVVLSSCAVPLCDRNAQVDLAKKSGDCGLPAATNLLGAKATCTAAAASCSKTDQDILLKALDCEDKLPVCTQDTRNDWSASQKRCFDPFIGLSKACSDAMFGGVLPGQDAGPDASVDAGPDPLDDGGNGVFLVGVADDTTMAFAWSTLQPGAAARWVLVGRDGGVSDETSIEPGSLISYTLGDGGAARRFYLVGYDTAGKLVFGDLDGGGTPTDAGPTGCNGPLDCPPDRVCDLNTCKTQTCVTGANTCPAGYDCLSSVCFRSFSDGGTFDAGAADASVSNTALPFISNSVSLARGPIPDGGLAIPMGGFAGRRADLVAIDSARVFVAMEQEGQLIGHSSSRHGLDFVQDQGTTSNIDTVGSRIKTAYNAESRTIFVCYNVGRSIRIRRSTDFGRSWGTTAATIDPVDDGGLSSKINDCDIAPWKNGGALMVTVDDDALAVRTISTALAVGNADTAFLASPPDAGNIQTPAHPALATLPADSIIHVTFTGTRILASSVSDSEPFAVYRDGSTSGFTQPKFLNPGVSSPGTNFPQDWTSVAVDPISKKALAAYTSLETGPGGTTIATIYTSLWGPTTHTWVTGSDLNVFAVDPRDNNTTLLFPVKLKNDLWDAFSANLSVSPAGKMYLSMVAGPRLGTIGDYRLYMVGFDFEAQSPGSTAKGWYVPPVRQLSTTRVFNPGSMSTVTPPIITSFGADSQISTYSTFVEGMGANGELEGREMFVPRP